MDGEGIDTGNYEETSNRASWNEFQKAHLVELLVEYHQPGTRKQNGWSSAAWNDITRRVNAKFSHANFSLKQIKEQEHTLKKQYKIIQHLRNQPGFGWDITTKMVTAPEEVWAPLLKDKEMKRWYNKPFPYYDALHKVYCGFIATGKRKRRSNNFTNNEDEDDFLNTQGENSPISTQPNLNFAQEPPPIQLSISASRREKTQLICASMEKKSDRTAIHNEECSVSAAVKTFERLQGFSKGDFVIASKIFINDAAVREVFLSCNEENKAPWIKAMIDEHKAKQKRQREELEQDANQNKPQSKLVRRISSMEIGRKRQWEELDQGANQNQPQSKLVRLNSSMRNQPQSCQMQVLIKIFTAIRALKFAVMMIHIRNHQYYEDEAVPTLRTQTLHIEELPNENPGLAVNQVPEFQPNMKPCMIEMNGELPVEHVEIFLSGQDTYVSNQREYIFTTDPSLNVPAPNAGMLHAPENRAQYMYIGHQRDPEALFGLYRMEHLHPTSSLNGYNGSSEAMEEMPEEPSTGQGMTMDNGVYSNQDYDINIDDFVSPDTPGLETCTLPNPMPAFQSENMGVGKQVAPESNLVSGRMERFPSNASFNGNNEPSSFS